MSLSDKDDVVAWGCWRLREIWCCGKSVCSYSTSECSSSV